MKQDRLNHLHAPSTVTKGTNRRLDFAIDRQLMTLWAAPITGCKSLGAFNNWAMNLELIF